MRTREEKIQYASQRQLAKGIKSEIGGIADDVVTVLRSKESLLKACADQMARLLVDNSISPTELTVSGVEEVRFLIAPLDLLEFERFELFHGKDDAGYDYMGSVVVKNDDVDEMSANLTLVRRKDGYMEMLREVGDAFKWILMIDDVTERRIQYLDKDLRDEITQRSAKGKLVMDCVRHLYSHGKEEDYPASNKMSGLVREEIERNQVLLELAQRHTNDLQFMHDKDRGIILFSPAAPGIAISQEGNLLVVRQYIEPDDYMDIDGIDAFYEEDFHDHVVGVTGDLDKISRLVNMYYRTDGEAGTDPRDYGMIVPLSLEAVGMISLDRETYILSNKDIHCLSGHEQMTEEDKANWKAYNEFIRRHEEEDEEM